MGKFSKIFNHIESKDLRNKYEQKKAARIEEEKKKEDTEKYIASAMEQAKYNWRSKIDVGQIVREGMTTSAVSVSKEIEAAPGDGTVTPVDAIDVNSYTGTTGVLAANDDLGANVGTQIRASGSGEGHGGFNVGGNYLAFQGTGSGGANARFAVLSAVDSTNIDTLQIKAIVGNDSNGGEDPDAAGEELYLMYKTPAMPEARFLIQKPDGSIPDGISGTEDIIIALGAAPNAGLNDYSITIPDYARAPGTQFILMQPVNSGVGFDHYGVTEIKFQRKAPIAVFVPLDNPEASSFIRSAPEGSTPKKRKKNVNDKLDASDEYTQAKFGNEFPGQEVRVGGEDPFKGAEIGDDVEPSPQTKDEVKKSFSKFSDRAVAAAQTTVRGAPTAEPEPESEPLPPSSQATMEPKDDNGEPIPVKPIGRGIAVQGADAANLDAQEPEPTDPQPFDPQPSDPMDMPEPEDLTNDEKEELKNQGKTPEEIKQTEDLKKEQQKLDKITDELIKRNDYLAHDVAGINEIFSNITWLIGAFNDYLNPIAWGMRAFGIDFNSGKLVNNLNIARSHFTGKVENHIPNHREIKEFTNSLIPTIFDTNSPSYIPISDVRHPYADDNIKVDLDGNVSVNDGTHQGLADKSYASLGDHGKGYAQLIIPKDGGRPYVHYYDYNYHNLNSPETGEVPNVEQEILSALTHLLGEMGLVKSLLTIPFVGALKKAIFNYEQVFDSLKNKSGLEGWPPGIHGAALTDFKVDIKNLPKETQEMIAAHPLSWTPERVANMSQEEITEQLYSVMKTEADYDDYFEYTADVTRMSTEPVNTVPYAVAMEEMDKVYEIYEKDLLKKYGEDGWDEFTSGSNRETSEFFAAERAAKEDLKTLESEEQKELDENDKMRGPQTQSDLWDKLVGPYFDALQKITSSGGSYDKNNPTYKKMVKGHAKWKKETDKMDDDYFKIQSEIMDKYRDLREPIRSVATYQARGLREPVKDSPTGQARYKIVDLVTGDESAGADYTALDGTVYKGQNTYYNEYYNEEENFMNQMSALYDPVADLEKYVQGNYVREAKIEEFGEKYKLVPGESWSPKKGSGKSKPDPKSDPDPRSSFAGTGADAATFSFDASTNRNNRKRKNNKRGTGFNEELLIKYARPIPKKGDLFERVKSKGFFDPDDIKPEFPENPPPKLDPKTGMHPEYGKKAKRYGKLDPISANSMPPTGDPETDAVVNKQKTINKIKKMARNK